MIIKGITIGKAGGITKYTMLVPKGVNIAELIEDMRHYYGWTNIQVV